MRRSVRSAPGNNALLILCNTGLLCMLDYGHDDAWTFVMTGLAKMENQQFWFCLHYTSLHYTSECHLRYTQHQEVHPGPEQVFFWNISDATDIPKGIFSQW